MSATRILIVGTIGVCAACTCAMAQAADLRIHLHKGSLVTPVQKLNRDGVEAIRKHQYEKAKNLFYKAYLYDPDDPFTLNNMGYIAELEGQVDRAQRFYALASQQTSNAVVDLASVRAMEGKQVGDVINNIGNLALEVNRKNSEAMRLLSQGRVHEAEQLLEETLRRDPNNAFTLNNLGAVKEIQGEDEDALRYYSAAARAGSGRSVVVTRDQASRGKPISDMASENYRKLQEFMLGEQTAEVRASRLNLRGVAALNRNDLREARQSFARAYALDRTNAFSLNNLGYLSELDGDWESAQSYYELAEKANRADFRVGLATRRTAEGMKLFDVAQENDSAAQGKMAAQQRLRQEERAPIVLKRRDGTPVDSPQAPPR